MSTDNPAFGNWEADRARCLKSMRETPGQVAKDLHELITLVERCLEAKDGTNKKARDAAEAEVRSMAEKIRQDLTELLYSCDRFHEEYPKECNGILGYLSANTVPEDWTSRLTGLDLESLRGIEEKMLRETGRFPEPHEAFLCTQTELLKALGKHRSNYRHLESLEKAGWLKIDKIKDGKRTRWLS